MTTSARNHCQAVSLAVLALLACTALGTACVTPLAPADESRVRTALDDARRAYPELDGKPISLAALDEETVFFQSSFAPGTLLGDAPLAYAIQANPRAFAQELPDDALRGVLGHELAHTLDYETRTRGSRDKVALAALLPLVVSPPTNSWERFTDLVAVDRGFGHELLRYRVWQFRVLGHEAVAEKKSIYYGPLELQLLLDVKARCPALFQTFLAQPPTSARAIATRCP